MSNITTVIVAKDEERNIARTVASVRGPGPVTYLGKGGRLAAVRMLVNPLVLFIKQFIVQLGFADGLTGLWIAALSATSQFLKYWYALTGSAR